MDTKDEPRRETAEPAAKRLRSKQDEPAWIVDNASLDSLCVAISYLNLRDAAQLVRACKKFQTAKRTLKGRRHELVLDLGPNVNRLPWGQGKASPFATNILVTAPALRKLEVLSAGGPNMPRLDQWEFDQWQQLLSETRHLRIMSLAADPHFPLRAGNIDAHEIVDGLGDLLSSMRVIPSTDLQHFQVTGYGTACAWQARHPENRTSLINPGWMTVTLGAHWSTLRVLSMDLSVNPSRPRSRATLSLYVPSLAVHPPDLATVLPQLVNLEILRLPIRVSPAQDTLDLFARVAPNHLHTLHLDCWQVDGQHGNMLRQITDLECIGFFRPWQSMLKACSKLHHMNVKFVDASQGFVSDVGVFAAFARSSRDTLSTNGAECSFSADWLFDRTPVESRPLYLELLRLSGIRNTDVLIECSNDAPSLADLDWKQVIDRTDRLVFAGASSPASPKSVRVLAARFPDMVRFAEMSQGALLEFQPMGYEDPDLDRGSWVNLHGLTLAQAAAYGHGTWDDPEQGRSTWAVTRLNIYKLKSVAKEDKNVAKVVAAFPKLDKFKLDLGNVVVYDYGLLTTLKQVSPDLTHLDLICRVAYKNSIGFWDRIKTLTRLRHLDLKLGKSIIQRLDVILQLSDLETFHLEVQYEVSAFVAADETNSLDGKTVFAALSKAHPKMTDLSLMCRIRELRDLPSDMKMPELQSFRVSWTTVWSIGMDSIDRFYKQHPKLCTLRLDDSLEKDQVMYSPNRIPGYGPCSLDQENAIRNSAEWKGRIVRLSQNTPLLTRPTYDPEQDIERHLPWRDEVIDVKAKFETREWTVLLGDAFRGGLVPGRHGHWLIDIDFERTIGSWRILSNNKGTFALLIDGDRTLEQAPETDTSYSTHIGLAASVPTIAHLTVVNSAEFLHPFWTTGLLHSKFPPDCRNEIASKVTVALYCALRMLLPHLPRSTLTHWMMLDTEPNTFALYERYAKSTQFLTRPGVRIELPRSDTRIPMLIQPESTAVGTRFTQSENDEDDDDEEMEADAEQKLLKTWDNELGASVEAKLTEALTRDPLVPWAHRVGHAKLELVPPATLTITATKPDFLRVLHDAMKTLIASLGRSGRLTSRQYCAQPLVHFFFLFVLRSGLFKSFSTASQQSSRRQLKKT